MQELLGNTQIGEQIKTPKIIIRKSTFFEENQRLKYTLGRLSFYRENHIRVNFPDTVFWRTYFNLPKNRPYRDTISFISNKDKPDYEKAVGKLEGGRKSIEESLLVFEKLRSQWDFTMLPNYKIVITRYGSTGSFDRKSGRIFLRIDSVLQPDNDPAMLPIHEIVHIGISKLVRSFYLSQSEIEGLVDIICSRLFSNALPNYKIRSTVDNNIVQYMSKLSSLENFTLILGDYIKKYPRKEVSVGANLRDDR